MGRDLDEKWELRGRDWEEEDNRSWVREMRVIKKTGHVRGDGL